MEKQKQKIQKQNSLTRKQTAGKGEMEAQLLEQRKGIVQSEQARFMGDDGYDIGMVI